MYISSLHGSDHVSGADPIFIVWWFVGVYRPSMLLTYLFSQCDINLRLHRWDEFLVDYNFQMLYDLGKANIVVNVLSKKTQIIMAILNSWILVEEFANLHRWPIGKGLICSVVVGLELIEQIWIAQKVDSRYEQLLRKTLYDDSLLSINEYGHIKYKIQIWLPKDEKLKFLILAELHNL